MKHAKEYIRDGRAPVPDNELTSRVMSVIKDRNTKPEMTLRKMFWNNGIRGYRVHWNKVPGRPDIAFPGKKFAIFVHGCFWHRCPYCKPHMPNSHSKFWRSKFERNVERDQRKIAQLEGIGWKAIIIWECQIKDDPIKSVTKIRKEIRECN